MLKIATLGPKETFSDLATQQYIKTQHREFNVQYFSSLLDTLNAIGKDCEQGVLPIENLSEGYVQVVLDYLLDTDLVVNAELLLPIKFSFVSESDSIQEVTDLYVQFVAHGQCSEFINGLTDIKVHSTQSNIESLLLANKQGKGAGAIIPQHAIAMAEHRHLVKENVTNYDNNQTRFLVLSHKAEPRSPELNYKTTLVVRNEDDCPGVLGNIVNSFAKLKVNLTSIMSRPTKSQFGQYHFFIDIDGHQLDDNIKQALSEIGRQYPVTVIGSYVKAEV